MTISQFKTHISRELQNVRRGEHIIIQDRNTPVAEVMPYEQEPDLVAQLPKHRPLFRKLSFRVVQDPLDLLLEEREKR